MHAISTRHPHFRFSFTLAEVEMRLRRSLSEKRGQHPIKFDLSIFEGSGNDSTEAEVAIAAAAVELYAAHAAAFPQTRRSPSAPDLAGPMVRPARRSRKCCARSGPRRPPRRTSSH